MLCGRSWRVGYVRTDCRGDGEDAFCRNIMWSFLKLLVAVIRVGGEVTGGMTEAITAETYSRLFYVTAVRQAQLLLLCPVCVFAKCRGENQPATTTLL